MDLDSHAETTSLQQSGPYGSLPTSIFASNPLMISQLAGPADLVRVVTSLQFFSHRQSARPSITFERLLHMYIIDAFQA